MDPMRILACALMVAAFSPMARAQTDTDRYPESLPITVDGKSATLYLALHLPLSPVASETLPDGTKHHGFASVVDDPHEWSSAWKFAFGPNDPAWYGPTEPYHIDTYLSPTGSSRLSFDWNYQVYCHGGCYNFAHLHFDLASTTGELFGDTLKELVFAGGHGVTGSGQERIVTTHDSDPAVPFIEITRFVVGTVPEPSSLPLVAAGLMTVGLALHKQRRQQAAR